MGTRLHCIIAQYYDAASARHLSADDSHSRQTPAAASQVKSGLDFTIGKEKYVSRREAKTVTFLRIADHEVEDH